MFRGSELRRFLGGGVNMDALRVVRVDGRGRAVVADRDSCVWRTLFVELSGFVVEQRTVAISGKADLGGVVC